MSIEPHTDPGFSFESSTGIHPIPEHTEDLSAGERRAMLVTLIGPEAGRAQVLGDQPVLIGRSPECAICLPDANVSRRHAQVAPAPGGGFVISDCQSRNGTTVNGRLIEHHRLELGDRIGVGRDVLLLFAPHDHLQQELIHQQRLESVGQLAGGIAHDFNNLLAVILGNVAALEGSAPTTSITDPEVKDILGEVKQASTRAAGLVRQLLTFSRKSSVETAVFDLSAVVTEALAMVARTLRSEVKIEAAITPMLRIKGDPTQLHQVVMNLAINARDAMPKGGVIKVSLTAAPPAGGAEPRVTLTVADTGVGMDPATQARIFEPYFTTKPIGRGTGLGLATVIGIVRSHGGKIEVDSTLGQGSTFRVRLSLCPLVKRDQNRDESTMSVLKVPGQRVLVVDDEEAYLRSTKRLLKAWGYSVFTAKNGAEALGFVRSGDEAPDVVLVDYMMPDMRGDEVCRRLRAAAPGLRILAMSGSASADIVDQVLRSGADGFLAKPFNKKELEGAIFQAFNPTAGA